MKNDFGIHVCPFSSSVFAVFNGPEVSVINIMKDAQTQPKTAP